MKILAIGDFHGKIPKKLKSRVKRYIDDVDLILSPGDYSGSDKYSKLFFKYVYGKRDANMETMLGKRRFNKLMKEILDSGINAVRWLNSLNKPILGITGNWDSSKYSEIGWSHKENNYENNKNYMIFANVFYGKIKKFRNFKFIEMSKSRFKDLTIIGHTKSSYPGNYNVINKKKYIMKYGLKKFNIIRNNMKKDYIVREKKFNKLFNKEKNVIFLGHNSPYGMLDIIGKKGHNLSKGEHYGDYLVRKTILKWKPRVYICGHMHEHQGLAKLGKTLIVNTGPGHNGKFAIIDYGEKIKVKLIK